MSEHKPHRADDQPPGRSLSDCAARHAPDCRPRFWGLVVATGVGAGLAGGMLMRLLHGVEHLAWSYETASYFTAVSKSSSERRIGNLLLAGVIVAISGKLLPRLLGGQPVKVNAAIWFRSGRVSPPRTMVEAVVSIVIVGLGTSLGREAAIKQAGAAVASWLGDWGRMPDPRRRLLVACGVGAGVGAAYNVPLGGALFAVEVLIGDLSLPLVLPALAASVIATAISWLMLPADPIYYVPHYALSPPLVVWSLVTGPLFGLAAAALVRTVRWSQTNRAAGWLAIPAPIVVLGLLGALAISYPQLLGNGKDTVQMAYTDEISFALFGQLPELKFLVTVACLAVGASGGLFTPTITIGSLLGGLLGHGLAPLLPGLAPGSCAIIGSAAVLAAASRGPVSAVVLILELTRHTDATMGPMLLAVVGAMLVMGRVESHSLYTARLPAPGAKLAPYNGRARLDTPILLDCRLVPASARYAQVVQALIAGSDPAGRLYVVDEHGQLVGEIGPGLAGQTSPDALPPAALTAFDLARPVTPLTTATEAGEARRRLNAAADGVLPVVDGETMRLVGIARAAHIKKPT